MTNTAGPDSTNHKPRRKLKVKVTDIVIFAVIIVVIAVLAVTLIGKLKLKHDVNGARTTSDKIIAALDKRDGMAVRKYGTKTFQSTYSGVQLTNQFKAIETVTEGTPKVDRQTVSNGKAGTVVLIIYKYPPKLAKMPYYVRVTLMEKSGAWQLSNISGSANESNLIIQ